MSFCDGFLFCDVFRGILSSCMMSFMTLKTLFGQCNSLIILTTAYLVGLFLKLLVTTSPFLPPYHPSFCRNLILEIKNGSRIHITFA